MIDPIEPPKFTEIDLEAGEYRSDPLHVLRRPVFKRSAIAVAVWFMLVVTFGRVVVHDLPWWCIALPACAPGALLAFIVLSLDD